MWRRYVCHVNGVERNAAAGLRGVEYLTCRLKILVENYFLRSATSQEIGQAINRNACSLETPKSHRNHPNSNNPKLPIIVGQEVRNF